VICLEAPGGKAGFTALITQTLPDVHLFGGTQCFPLYTYESAVNRTQPNGLKQDEKRIGDYIRRENISDTILQKFREHYSREPATVSPITKEDIFYYVYGILHSRSYRERFAAELKKQLPRIPFATDFKGFSKAGRKLAELHLNYETLEPYPLQEHGARSASKESFHVAQMKFPTKTDKSKIIYNTHLTLEGIPPETYRYIVNGKSALEWVMERYAIAKHKDSGIENDPNDWCKKQDDERYIVDLVKRIVTLSVESVKIIEGLPVVAF
jgi:predicted helicase